MPRSAHEPEVKYTIHYLPILTQEQRGSLGNPENFVPAWWILQHTEVGTFLFQGYATFAEAKKELSRILDKE